MHYVLHYSDPGDIILDAFCGTGMTGIAARLCGNAQEVQELGLEVSRDGCIFGPDGDYISHLSPRKALLNDLSPMATFIASNLNYSIDTKMFKREARRILHALEEEFGWLYQTWHKDKNNSNQIEGTIEFVIWSDIFVCPECNKEITFWKEAIDLDNGRVRGEFPRPNCSTSLSKQNLDRAWNTYFDSFLGVPITQAKQKPVLINYSVGRRRYEKVLDPHDLAVLEKIEEHSKLHYFPAERLPEGDESRQNDRSGMSHLHHFFTPRNQIALAALWRHINKVEDKRVRMALILVFTAILPNASKMRRFERIVKVAGHCLGLSTCHHYSRL